ncbi:MAG: glycerol-3-phosphate acyltransferase [Deltaproteobacteria bacterium]|nr:glycerol-3-phosphate acyltransferase [Deltaproteobacteria bacterium]
MPAYVVEIALVVLAYALGSISFGLIIAGRRGIDLRSVGSGNTGATNVGRAVGKREGRVVLLLDGLKGALPALLAGAWSGLDSAWTAATAVAAVAGHCWPIWHQFRGGKGAATAAGAMLVVAWPAGLAAIATYLIAKRASRKVSVGSLAGATVGAAVAIVGAATWDTGGHAAAFGACAIALLVWIRHADNVARLRRGEEPDG